MAANEMAANEMAANQFSINDMITAIFKNDKNDKDETRDAFEEECKRVFVSETSPNRSTNTNNIDDIIITEYDYPVLGGLLAKYTLNYMTNGNHFSPEQIQRLQGWVTSYDILNDTYKDTIRLYGSSNDGGRRRSKRSHRKTRKGKSQKHRSKGGRRGKSRKH